MPIYAGGGNPALDVTLRFDASEQRFVGVRRPAAARGVQVAWHEPGPGVVRVAVASASVLDGRQASLLALFEARRPGGRLPAVTVTSNAETRTADRSGH